MCMIYPNHFLVPVPDPLQFLLIGVLKAQMLLRSNVKCKLSAQLEANGLPPLLERRVGDLICYACTVLIKFLQ